MCLLFSGGTFLYVATAHILPEIQASPVHEKPVTNSRKRNTKIVQLVSRTSTRKLDTDTDDNKEAPGVSATSSLPSASIAGSVPSSTTTSVPSSNVHKHHKSKPLSTTHQSGMTWIDVCILLAGLLLPLLLNVEHGH
jgi:hypothetical protein